MYDKKEIIILCHVYVNHLICLCIISIGHIQYPIFKCMELVEFNSRILMEENLNPVHYRISILQINLTQCK